MNVAEPTIVPTVFAVDQRIVEARRPVEAHQLRLELERLRPRPGRRALDGARAPEEHRRRLQIRFHGEARLAARALGDAGLADLRVEARMLDETSAAEKVVVSETWNS
jgi:hypothetical protein